MDGPTRTGSGKGRRRYPQRGLTYLGFVIALAVINGLMAATAEVWLSAQRREKEQELLFVGNEFRQALAAYDKGTPGGAAQNQPKHLEELLKDNRYPNTKRYLRQIYADPMTGKTEWGLVRLPDGGIIGVHSLSEKEPFKKTGFRLADAALQDKTKYSEWTFMNIGQTSSVQQQAPASDDRRKSGR